MLLKNKITPTDIMVGWSYVLSFDRSVMDQAIMIVSCLQLVRGVRSVFLQIITYCLKKLLLNTPMLMRWLHLECFKSYVYAIMMDKALKKYKSNNKNLGSLYMVAQYAGSNVQISFKSNSWIGIALGKREEDHDWNILSFTCHFFRLFDCSNAGAAP